jgi:hypothetical protein
MSRLGSGARRAALAATCGLGLVLAGCASDNGNGGIAGTGFGGGALAGAAGAGTLAGVALRNKSPVVATAAVLGAAALGGFLGDKYLDQPRQQQTAARQQAQQDTEYQRKLDYERQSALQAEQTRKEIEEQRLYEQWRQQRLAGSGVATASATGDDVLAAQRLLRGLGYYNGPLDGDYGPRTRSAIIAFERAQGMTPTGNVSPSLIAQLRSSI